MRKNGFAKGSGAYKCRSCGRVTRATGRKDNENVGLCAECYDLAGIENAISDDGGCVSDLEEGARLYKEIIAKGGNYSLEYPEKFAPYLEGGAP